MRGVLRCRLSPTQVLHSVQVELACAPDAEGPAVELASLVPGPVLRSPWKSEAAEPVQGRTRRAPLPSPAERGIEAILAALPSSSLPRSLCGWRIAQIG